MKYDEFGFLNQQLAGMLKSGIPLEGALRQLCSTMQRGRLRTEFELLEADLAKGIPLKQALETRKLPEFYLRMLAVGAESNDLPGVLTLLADYYHQMNFLWTRMKGLLVYPLIVLAGTFCLSVLMLLIYRNYGNDVWGIYGLQTIAFGQEMASAPRSFFVSLGGLLLAPLIVGGLLATILLFAFSNRFKQWASWSLPGYREAHLTRFASSLNLMLRSGCTLPTALGLMRQMEKGTPLENELVYWQNRMAAGYSKLPDLTSGSVLPPLFVWMLSSEGENWVGGLGRAAEIYYQRAVYKAEILLNAALPVCILFLGAIIVMQLFSMLNLITGADGIVGFVKSLSEF